MKVFAFVPAKGTSDRVENKNMRFLDGERLYIRALRTLLECKEIDQVFLDTESDAMYEQVNYLPIHFMKRSPTLANNQTDGHQLFINEIKAFPQADIYVQLLCTSPFISPKTIDDALRKLKTNNEYDSALLMKKDKYYFWKDGTPLYDRKHIPNSRDLPETVSESMGLYISRKEAALRCQARYGQKPLFLWGKLEENIDVNTPEDLTFAETLARGRREQEIKHLELIKHFISSCALSDLIDDMNEEKEAICGAVLPHWKSNIQHCKIMGRAATLRIRKLKTGEDFRGIYKALESYEGLAQNDIVVVENEVKELAYFGDLNARLALRAGASAAIIDGMTRDVAATTSLGFPVFARGYNAQDVRHHATLDYINKPISIEGQSIHPGDLIFIDENAVVVIYRKYEKEILERVIKIFQNEKNIIYDILNNKKAEEICRHRGEF